MTLDLRPAVPLLLCLLLVLVGSGCAYKPPVAPPMDFVERAETLTDDDVTVRAVVLSDKETSQAFAAPLSKHGVQPVWVEIENGSPQEWVLMLLTLDPNYYSPGEAAWKSRRFGESNVDEKKRFFYEQQIPFIIDPHSTASGYVYTNYDPGAKAFTVELVGNRETRTFEFVQLVPGLEADFMKVDFDDLYTPEEIEDLDLAGLRAYVEALPPAALGGDQKTPGDPLNIVVVGEGRHVLATFIRQRWDLTETVRPGTAWKTVASSLFKAHYRTSPVSPLYLFDRPHDVALQKARANVDERNHLRLWKAPVTLEGRPVFVGQISRDIGVRLSSVTLVTHQIDPLVDEARLYLILDLAASQALGKIAFARGVGMATVDAPRFNFTKDPYLTDGLRAVLILTDENETVAIDEIENLHWERPSKLMEVYTPRAAPDEVSP